MEAPKICWFCFEVNEEVNLVTNLQTDMLQIVFPKMHITDNTVPTICNACANILKQAFTFKSTCIEIEDSLQNYTNEGQIDLEVIIGVKVGDEAGARRIKICRTCLEYVENDEFVALDEANSNKYTYILQQCLPEMDIRLTKAPLLCAKCVGLLEVNFNFVTNFVNKSEQMKTFLTVEEDDLKYASIIAPVTEERNTFFETAVGVQENVYVVSDDDGNVSPRAEISFNKIEVNDASEDSVGSDSTIIYTCQINRPDYSSTNYSPDGQENGNAISGDVIQNHVDDLYNLIEGSATSDEVVVVPNSPDRQSEVNMDVCVISDDDEVQEVRTDFMRRASAQQFIYCKYCYFRTDSENVLEMHKLSCEITQRIRKFLENASSETLNSNELAAGQTTRTSVEPVRQAMAERNPLLAEQLRRGGTFGENSKNEAFSKRQDIKSAIIAELRNPLRVPRRKRRLANRTFPLSKGEHENLIVKKKTPTPTTNKINLIASETIVPSTVPPPTKIPCTNTAPLRILECCSCTFLSRSNLKIQLHLSSHSGDSRGTPGYRETFYCQNCLVNSNDRMVLHGPAGQCPNTRQLLDTNLVKIGTVFFSTDCSYETEDEQLALCHRRFCKGVCHR